MNTPTAVSLLRVLLGSICLASYSTSIGNNSPNSARVQYLSGVLSDRIVSESQSWGELGFDVCAHTSRQTPLKLRILDKEYAHGLGHHANGEIVVDLGRQFLKFMAEVGVEWQGGSVGSVRFSVFVDGKKAFASGVMRETDCAKPVSISVKGARVLRLVVDDAGDGITCDAADWAEARLIPDPEAHYMNVARMKMNTIDMAKFANVAAWDPRSQGGTTATRVTEFPAKDIAPFKELLPEMTGTFKVPVADGVGCIGLQWFESRLLSELSMYFASSAQMPSIDSIAMQFWDGESVWQGKWVDAGVTPEQSGNSIVWRLRLKDHVNGTPKVRWLFRNVKKGFEVQQISAFTRSLAEEVKIRIEPARSIRVGRTKIIAYNGVLLDSKSPDLVTWSGVGALDLKIRSTICQAVKSDRTVLRFQISGMSFGVAVDDLLTNDAMYLPSADLYITRLPAPRSKHEYLRSIASRRSVLDDVRSKPDQSFPHSWNVVHNPVQDFGPTLLSLACDNRKFQVEREGSILFNTYDKPDDPHWVTEYSPKGWNLATKCGLAEKLAVTRKLDGGWYPILVRQVNEGVIRYTQTTFVAPYGPAEADKPTWMRQRAACVTELVIRNPSQTNANAGFTAMLSSPEHLGFQIESVKEGLLATAGDRVLALVTTPGNAGLALELAGNGFTLSGTMKPGSISRCTICIPAWAIARNDYRVLLPGKAARSDAKHYWDEQMAHSMSIYVPDVFLTNLIKASQVHCLIAARCEGEGNRIAPWISADRYGPLESESNSIIRGMDLTGHPDFARRCLDYFLAKTNPAGFITTGYTVVGTGECLWTLGEYFNRSRNVEWLRKNAKQVVHICQWVCQQRLKTMRHDALGDRVPEYGLMPPGVTADWNRFDFRFFNDAQYQHGLAMAGKALAGIGDPNAKWILEDASEYKADILHAYSWSQARMPVVPLANRTWVPGSPTLLDCFGRPEDLFPSEDANRTWCYGVEAGAHNLVANGILAPHSTETDSILNDLEDVQFLHSGWGDYPEERNRTDVYDFGGFSKVQPYYTRIAEVYALRDDVKPFIRSYFNAIPSLVSRENLTFWEHFANQGGWNKTHETGWFLCQSRTMFVTERGNDLCLAPFITNQWLKDGMKVSVQNAPTNFGSVSYTIQSWVAQGRIDAVVELGKGFTGRRVLLRLRHPVGKPIHSVLVQGKPWTSFDPNTDTIDLRPSAKPISISAHY